MLYARLCTFEHTITYIPCYNKDACQAQKRGPKSLMLQEKLCQFLQQVHFVTRRFELVVRKNDKHFFSQSRELERVRQIEQIETFISIGQPNQLKGWYPLVFYLSSIFCTSHFMLYNFLYFYKTISKNIAHCLY